MAILISADELKKTIPGYDPKKSHMVHVESAWLADATEKPSDPSSSVGLLSRL
jgi:hypothetical protein